MRFVLKIFERKIELNEDGSYGFDINNPYMLDADKIREYKK